MMLQVYTGTGKGKTTAALGAAFRAYGYGLKVVMFSFLKNDENYGEIKANKKLELLKIYQLGRDAFVNFHNPDKIDLEMARAGWERIKKIIVDHTVDIVILDEINLVLATGMLCVREVIDFLQQYKYKTEIITTGRNAPKELIDIADLVTDMHEVKHYLSRGVVSRNGFEH